MKNKFARCLTNLSYAAWVLGSFMLSFYSEVLPKRAAYDFIHFRNYFLMSTIIVIILQDIHFIREKLYARAKNTNINSISMKNINEMEIVSEFKDKVGYDRDRRFLEEAFSDEPKQSSQVINLFFLYFFKFLFKFNLNFSNRGFMMGIER